MEKTYSAARIRPEEHRETLARLWKENLAQAELAQDLVERRMRWFHEENPAGPARTWMGFHGPERQIIGCGSFYPRDTWIAGHRLRGGILGDFAVNKDHRIAGAAMSIQREIARSAREAGADFLYAFPNKASFPIFQRAGYKKIGESAIWVKPLSSAYKLRELAAAPIEVRRSTAREIADRAMDRVGGVIPSARWSALWRGQDGAPARLSALQAWAEALLVRATGMPDGPLLRAAAAAVDGGMAARDAAAIRARSRRVDGEITSRADARFDALWERASRRFIAGERTAAYLNWRYAGFTTAPFRFFCLLDAADRSLLGYAVISARNNKIDIVDMYAEDFEGTFDLVLLKLCEAMRREGVAAVGLTYVGPAWIGERLRALGFFRRDLAKEVGSRWLIAHMDAGVPADLRERVLDVDQWFMTDGELDA